MLIFATFDYALAKPVFLNFKIQIFRGKMLGIYFAGHTAQFNNFNNFLVNTIESELAFLLLWNEFGS